MAHSHWRLLFTKAATSSGIWLDEVSFRSAADVDLSVGGTISASSTEATFAASQAFDKSIATNGWRSLNAFPAWIAYQHSSAVDVDSVLVTLATDANNAPVDGSVFLQWSDDGSQWFNEGFAAYRESGAWTASAVVRLRPLVTLSATATTSSPSLFFGNRLPQSPLRATSFKANVARRDVIDSGDTDIDGIVQIEGTPAARRVRLFESQSGRLLRETFSSPAGVYRFPSMRSDTEYILLADDHQRVYNAVVADKIKAAP